MKSEMRIYYETIICKKCGYYNKFYYHSQNKKIICKGCGRYIYKNRKEEFKEKMKGILNEKRNNNIN